MFLTLIFKKVYIVFFVPVTNVIPVKSLISCTKNTTKE